MHVMQIVKVRLMPEAEYKLSKALVERINTWLTQWTCINNFKATILPTIDDCLVHCTKTLQAQLVPNWLKSESVDAHHFQFQVSSQAVENNEFWLNTSIISGHWNNI